MSSAEQSSSSSRQSSSSSSQDPNIIAQTPISGTWAIECEPIGNGIYYDSEYSFYGLLFKTHDAWYLDSSCSDLDLMQEYSGSYGIGDDYISTEGLEVSQLGFETFEFNGELASIFVPQSFHLADDTFYLGEWLQDENGSDHPQAVNLDYAYTRQGSKSGNPTILEGLWRFPCSRANEEEEAEDDTYFTVDFEFVNNTYKQTTSVYTDSTCSAAGDIAGVSVLEMYGAFILVGDVVTEGGNAAQKINMQVTQSGLPDGADLGYINYTIVYVEDDTLYFGLPTDENDVELGTTPATRPNTLDPSYVFTKQ